MVIAYLRYLPDPDGDRVLGGVRYSRVSNLKETTALLKKFYPQYLNYVADLGLTLQTVSLNCITKIYKPQTRLREIIKSPRDALEKICSKFVETLSHESGVPFSSFGVTGSSLIGLSRESSDVDIIVYGRDQGSLVYQALKKLRRAGSWIEPYTAESVVAVLNQRWGGIGLELSRLMGIEVNKVLHGRVSGRDYFIRLLREYDYVFPSHPVEGVVFRGKISDASCSMFTPVTYSVEDIDWVSTQKGIKSVELLSYRGKFTEHTHQGERVQVHGTLEEIRDPEGPRFRVVLGDDSDYLIPYY